MTKSERFKTAHKLAREIRKDCSDYRTAFSCALRAIYEGYTTPCEPPAIVGAFRAHRDKCRMIKKLEEFGIKAWEKDGMRRYYINECHMRDVFRLDVDYDADGDISSASLDGKDITSEKAYSYLGMKIYYDTVFGKWMQRQDSRAPESLDEELFDALQI